MPAAGARGQVADERRFRLPDRPTIGGSVRAVLGDFYYNSWRLVPANVIWGVGLIVFVLLLGFWLPAAAAMFVLLALPTAGVYRMAALIVREEAVSFSDSLTAWRRFLGPALLTGATVTVLTSVLGVNLVVGLASGDAVGWIVGTLGGWGLLATWAVALTFWPLLVDPVREDEPLPRRLSLAISVLLVRPLTTAGLLALSLVLTALSVIFFAALPTITLAIVALLGARYTLPTADRLEGRQTQALPE